MRPSTVKKREDQFKNLDRDVEENEEYNLFSFLSEKLMHEIGRNAKMLHPLTSVSILQRRWCFEFFF